MEWVRQGVRKSTWSKLQPNSRFEVAEVGHLQK